MLDPRSLAHCIIPLFEKDIHFDGSFAYFPHSSAQVGDIFYSTLDKPEELYYLTSHLNLDSPFVEFLWDKSRSGGLYDSTAAHAHVVHLCLDTIFKQQFLPVKDAM